MAENNKENGNFFLGAVFTAVIFFLLFFSTRLRSAFGLGDNSGAIAAAAGAGGNGLGTVAGGCVKVCDDCGGDTVIADPYKPTPPAFIGPWTSTAGQTNTAARVNSIGVVINPYGI